MRFVKFLLPFSQFLVNVPTVILFYVDQVLWPECGWQPVSLTDLITGASVKKVYRKATLCIHPDKVQQKGATLQQKYVAEKVFDLLKVLLLRSEQFNLLFVQVHSVHLGFSRHKSLFFSTCYY